MLLRIFAALLILLLILQCAGCFDVQLHTSTGTPHLTRSENAIDATSPLPAAGEGDHPADGGSSRGLGRGEVSPGSRDPAARRR